MFARPGGPIPVARTRIVVRAAAPGPATPARRLGVSVPAIRVAAPDRLLATATPARPATASRRLGVSAPAIRVAAPDRLLATATPPGPATAARWIRVSAPGIRVAVPERLFAAAAPAEQPAPAAAARVGRLGKLLEHTVQAIEVGHQAATALRRLAAARRLAGLAPVRTRPVGVPPVRTILVGTPPPGAALAAAAFFWFGRFALDGAGDDPVPAGPSLAVRVRGLPGRAGRAGYERAPGRLCRRGIPPCGVPARRPRPRRRAPGIPAS